MLGLISLLYLFLFLGFVIASFVVLFHLVRYSLNRSTAWLSGSLFTVVMGVLLLANILLFFNLPWEALLTETISL